MDSALLALTERYRASLTEKCAEVARVYLASLVPGQVTVNRILLQSLLDRLSGSAGSYGFAALGEAARVVCVMIEKHHRVLVPAALDRERAEQLAAAMDQVHQAFQKVLGPPGVYRVLLVADQAEFAEPLASALAGEYFAVHTLTEPAGLPAALGLVTPDLLLFDFQLRGETAADLLIRLGAPGAGWPPAVALAAELSPEVLTRAREASLIQVFASDTPVAALAGPLRLCARARLGA